MLNRVIDMSQVSAEESFLTLAIIMITISVTIIIVGILGKRRK